MKTIKPLSVGLLHRTFENARQPFFMVGLFATFSLDEPRRLHSEIDLWKMVGEDLTSGLFDEGLAKPRGEVLVAGHCYPPRPPQVASYVRVQIGSVDKRLAVVGDRWWKRGVPTEPIPFSEMPIDYAHAFGRAGFARNPLGKGAGVIEDDDERSHPLPNIEQNEGLVRSPGQRPEPASFLPLDLTWPQRTSLMGKDYGAEWLEKRSPGPSVDFDAGFFQLGPRDQQLADRFRGDETFLIENMHPEKARIDGALPSLAGRVFVTQRNGEGERFLEIPTQLETVWFFPHRMRGVLVFRGVLPVAEDDAADLVHLVAGLEERGKPKGQAHYARVLAERLDPDDGALLSLADDDLLPAEEDGWQAAGLPTDMDALTKSRGFMQANMKRKSEKVRADARADILERGLSPADYGLDTEPEEPVIPGIDRPRELLQFVKEQRAQADDERTKAEAKREEAHADARKLAAEHGLDWDAMQKEGERSGPPRIGVEKQLASMREMLAIAKQGGVELPELEAMANDPEHQARLLGLEEQLVDTYRRSAHFMPKGKEVSSGARARLREKVVEAREARHRLDDPDLTGADLSGLDLSGMDLTGCFLEGALLVETNLTDATLDDVVLAQADLTGAKLDRASCVGANFGSSVLSKTTFVGANLTRSVFARAQLSDVGLAGATLDEADFFETVMTRVRLSGARGSKLVFLRLDLRDADFRGAILREPAFIECNMEGSDFSDAELEKARLIAVKGSRACFRRARLDGMFVGHGSVFDDAVFEGARMLGANLRSTRMAKADLCRVVLGQGDLSECDLQGARLDELDAQGAVLIRAGLRGASLRGANLLGAILQKADLRGADLEGANLFRSDLSRVRLDQHTRIEGALVEQSRVEPRRAST